MVFDSLFHLRLQLFKPSLYDTLHQGLLIDQETHVIADEPLRCSLQFLLMVAVLVHRLCKSRCKVTMKGHLVGCQNLIFCCPNLIMCCFQRDFARLTSGNPWAKRQNNA